MDNITTAQYIAAIVTAPGAIAAFIALTLAALRV